MTNPYPIEELDDYDDDGTMVNNVDTLSQAIIGRRIMSAERVALTPASRRQALVLTLDDGRRVELLDSSDCCAYTELEDFFLHPESVRHAILGVGTTDKYTTWHIYADFGDIMTLKVGWSCGNPFFYGYGFDINVRDVD